MILSFVSSRLSAATSYFRLFVIRIRPVYMFSCDEKTQSKRIRIQYTKLKRDSEKILAADTHRNKRATYKTENAEEKKMFEQHCVKVILDCHKRRFAIKLSIPLVTQILMNESVKFDYDWLRNMQFSHCYVSRFLKEHELVWTGKKSDQTYISDDQMSIYRFVIWIIRN